MSPLIWVFLFVFIDVLGFSIILPLFPYYGEEFGISPFTIGMLMTSNALTQMISAPFIGRFSDAYGRRPLLLLCFCGTVAGFLMLATATTVTELFISRILDGLLGGNISLAQAYIADVTDGKDRSKAFGVIGAAFGLGFIFGPAIGGVLSIYGYRMPAIIATIVSFINLVGVFLWLPESLPAEKRKVGDAGKPKELNLFDLNSFFKFLDMPVLGPLMILRFCYGYTFTLFETCFGFFNIERFSMEARTSSYMLAYVAIIFSMVQGQGIKSFTKRFNEGRVILYSFLALSISLALWVSSYTMTALFVTLFPLSFSCGLLNTLINSEITRQVQQSEMGETLGLSASIGSLTRVLAPVSSGFLIKYLGIWAPGIFGSLLMLYMMHYTYVNKLDQLSSQATPSSPENIPVRKIKSLDSISSTKNLKKTE